MGRAIVIKIGGSTLGSHDTTIEDVVELQRQGKLLVVVHGGGKLITDWLAKQGVSSRFVRGERVTDQATLEVVVSVLAGLVNKEIVADINALGGRAVGVSGVDATLIEGRIRDKEMGYVGEVTRVNTGFLETILGAAFIPVVAPVGFNSFDREADAPRTLNFNADIVAGEIAAAMGAEKLIFLTDVAGILDRSGKLLCRLSPGEAEALVASGVASGGMIPKIRACLRALSNTSRTCIIDGRQPHILLREIEGHGGGTTIKQKEENGMVTLVQSDEDVAANVRQFNRDLEDQTDIVTQLSQFRHWYYIPRIGFGPSKFIGYKNMNTSDYRRGADKTGIDTERILRRWFVSISKNGQEYQDLFPQLKELLLRYNKKPRSNTVIHVRRGL